MNILAGGKTVFEGPIAEWMLSGREDVARNALHRRFRRKVDRETDVALEELRELAMALGAVRAQIDRLVQASDPPGAEFGNRPDVLAADIPAGFSG